MCCGHNAEMGGTPIQNLLQMSRLMITHTHTWDDKFYYSFNKVFLERSEQTSQGLKMAGESRIKKTGLRVV